jgi:type IV pilus assembly protein PilX
MTPRLPPFGQPLSNQRGVSLIVVMIMLSAIFVIVAFGSRLTLLGEKSARNDRDRQIAFQAAEAALSDAEVDLM